MVNNQMTVLFLLMVIGYIAVKFKLADGVPKPAVGFIVVTQPLVMIASYPAGRSRRRRLHLTVLAVGLIMYMVLPWWAWG